MESENTVPDCVTWIWTCISLEAIIIYTAYVLGFISWKPVYLKCDNIFNSVYSPYKSNKSD